MLLDFVNLSIFKLGRIFLGIINNLVKNTQRYDNQVKDLYKISLNNNIPQY